ncbi:MAG: hypothetical protein P8Y72_07155 [Anaerolineales bacterium]
MAKTSNAMKHSPILWIEGRWSGNPEFVSLLRKKGFFIETISTGKKALEMASKNKYELLIVNAASMRTSGGRICPASGRVTVLLTAQVMIGSPLCAIFPARIRAGTSGCFDGKTWEGNCQGKVV